MKTFFLKSKRLGFSRWNMGDLQLAGVLWGNAGVSRYITGSGYTDAQIKQRLHDEIQSQKRDGVQYWPLYQLADGSFTGCCGLHRLDDGTFELGYHLLPVYWGKGYATEAANAVITYAFDELGIQSLGAGHHPDNHASGAVLLKAGFSPAGEVFYPPTGLLHKKYLLSKDDYRSPL